MKTFFIVCASFLLGILWFAMSLVCCAFVTRFDIVDHNSKTYRLDLSKDFYVNRNFDWGVFILYILFWWIIIPILGITIWTLKKPSFFQDITKLSKSFITKLVPEDPR